MTTIIHTRARVNTPESLGRDGGLEGGREHTMLKLSQYLGLVTARETGCRLFHHCFTGWLSALANPETACTKVQKRRSEQLQLQLQRQQKQQKQQKQQQQQGTSAVVAAAAATTASHSHARR